MSRSFPADRRRGASPWPALLALAATLPAPASAAAVPVTLVCQGDAFASSGAPYRLAIDPDRRTFDGRAEGLTQSPDEDGATMKTCRARFIATKSAYGLVIVCDGMAAVGGAWTNAVTVERWSLDRTTGRLTYALHGAGAGVEKSAACAPEDSAGR